MRRNLTPAPEDRDPRESRSAEVIDLATRRVLPTVSQRRRGDGLGTFAGVVIVGALGALTLWTMNNARTGQAAPHPVATMPAPAAPMPAPAMAPAPAPARQPMLMPPLGAPAPAMAPTSDPRMSPTVVFDASTGTMLPGGPVTMAPGGTPGNSPEDFATRLGATGGGRTVAEIQFDPKTTVTQGTLIPAILETAIDTDVPGFVRAVVSADVRSFDGSQVLVPRSSRLIGQYRSGLAQGQKRAYVIWTRLIRPDGASVNLGSPAVAFGGETGLAGKVQTHFFERFGSAMMLSVVGGLSALGGGATAIVVGGTGQSAAAAAVGQTGQIAPTVRVRQGQPIRVFTAKDLDFSKVS